MMWILSKVIPPPWRFQARPGDPDSFIGGFWQHLPVEKAIHRKNGYTISIITVKNESLQLQPGKYRVVFRALNAKQTLYTVIRFLKYVQAVQK